jgi:hypothetical protein
MFVATGSSQPLQLLSVPPDEQPEQGNYNKKQDHENEVHHV